MKSEKPLTQDEKDDDFVGNISRMKNMRLASSSRLRAKIRDAGGFSRYSLTSHEEMKQYFREYKLRDWILRFLPVRDRFDNKPTNYDEDCCLICNSSCPAVCLLAKDRDKHDRLTIAELKVILNYLPHCKDCGSSMFDEWSVETFVENMLKNFDVLSLWTLRGLVHVSLLNLEDDYYVWLEEHEDHWCPYNKTEEEKRLVKMESVD